MRKITRPDAFRTWQAWTPTSTSWTSSCQRPVSNFERSSARALATALRRRREDDRLHPIGVGRSADVRALAIERRPERLRRRSDVVAEEIVALLGDAQAVDVDPGRDLRPGEDDAVLGLLEDLVAGVVAEERLRRLDVLVVDAAQHDVGADHRRVGGLVDHRVERRDVTEAVLGAAWPS